MKAIVIFLLFLAHVAAQCTSGTKSSCIAEPGCAWCFMCGPKSDTCAALQGACPGPGDFGCNPNDPPGPTSAVGPTGGPTGGPTSGPGTSTTAPPPQGVTSLSFSSKFKTEECISTTGSGSGGTPFVFRNEEEEVDQKRGISNCETTLEGEMWYSFPSHKLRIDGKVLDVPFSIIYDYTKGVKYNTTNGKCRCQKIDPEDENDDFGREPVFFVPIEASSGATTSIKVNNVDIDVTPYTESIAYGGITYNSVLYVGEISGKQYIARFKATFDAGGVNYEETSDFYNVNDGEPDSKKFTPNCGCSENRAAPSKKPSSTCNFNDNPPTGAEQGCQCVKLDFCDMINYPIDGVIPARDADYGAQQTYNAQVAVFSSLSASCKTSLKNFICTSVFLRCEKDRVFYSPCRSMCPVCDCTKGEAIGSLSCSFYNDKDTCVSIGSSHSTSCLKDSGSSSSSTILFSLSLISSLIIFALKF